MFIRFDVIHERDGQTDSRQTLHDIASHGKKMDHLNIIRENLCSHFLSSQQSMSYTINAS